MNMVSARGQLQALSNERGRLILIYMKEILCTLALSLIPLTLVGAQELTLKAPINYEIDLNRLYEAALSGDDSTIPRDKLLILVGDIGSQNIIEDDGDTFLAEVELVGGHWNGEETIELYRASILFDGVAYRELFDHRSEKRFANGQKLMIVAQYLGLDNDYTGDELIPILLSLYFRRIR